MKSFVVGTVMLAAALFTFQPASASVETVGSVNETVITAPVVDLPVDSPVVATVPAPVVEPAPVATAPKVAPVAQAPVVVAPVAPSVDPYSGNPIVDCEAQGLITAEDASCVSPTFYTPETVPVECLEDMPCWDCSTMGNLICGRDEAYALSGFTDWETFSNRYGALQLATAPQHDGYYFIPSVINPTYVYGFTMTDEQAAAQAAAK